MKYFKLILSALSRYFYFIGIFSHIALALCVILSIIWAGFFFHSYNQPIDIFLAKASQYLAKSKSGVLRPLAAPVKNIGIWFESSVVDIKYTYQEQGVIGASTQWISEDILFLDDRVIQHHERLLPFKYSRITTVDSEAEILAAIKNARAGDDIVIAPGRYFIKARQIYLKVDGNEYSPIRLRAEKFGEVTMMFDTMEGMVIQGDYWAVENIKIMGSCPVVSHCEHAIHIVGANHTIIKNNEMRNFNSIIKANGYGPMNNRQYPDDVLIEHNTFINDSVRPTDSAVTLIDSLSGNDWVIRKNIIANNSKGGGDNISYAAFLKGNSQNGLFEQNIVDCEKSLADDGSIRIGLSLGGGGTGLSYCREGICPVEHNAGVIKNNLIVNCSQDVGIYLNKASNTIISHNTILNSTGIDVRFPESSATIVNNLLSGSIRERNQGKLTQIENISKVDYEQLVRLPTVKSANNIDLCSMERSAFSYVGAMSQQCINKIQFEYKNEE